MCQSFDRAPESRFPCPGLHGPKMNENQKRLQKRVVEAAEAALSENGYVSPIDVFIRMGLLAPSHLESWRKGRLR
jgi:hypothetical protein